MGAALAAGVDQRVGKNQAALGIRIEHSMVLPDMAATMSPGRCACFPACSPPRE